MKTPRNPRDRKVWVPATPAYYWGTIVGASVFLIPCAVVLLVLTFILVNFAPQMLTSPFGWGRLWSFIVTILCLSLSFVAGVTFVLSVRSALDRLWVTPTKRDHLLNIHREWYEACRSVDPDLDHPELWPERPY